MEDVELAGELGAEEVEDVEEDHGIGTGGDGDADVLGRRVKEPVAKDVGGDAGEERGGGVRGQCFNFTATEVPLCVDIK